MVRTLVLLLSCLLVADAGRLSAGLRDETINIFGDYDLNKDGVIDMKVLNSYDY